MVKLNRIEAFLAAIASGENVSGSLDQLLVEQLLAAREQGANSEQIAEAKAAFFLAMIRGLSQGLSPLEAQQQANKTFQGRIDVAVNTIDSPEQNLMQALVAGDADERVTEVINGLASQSEPGDQSNQPLDAAFIGQLEQNLVAVKSSAVILDATKNYANIASDINQQLQLAETNPSTLLLKALVTGQDVEQIIRRVAGDGDIENFENALSQTLNGSSADAALAAAQETTQQIAEAQANAANSVAAALASGEQLEQAIGNLVDNENFENALSQNLASGTSPKAATIAAAETIAAENQAQAAVEGNADHSLAIAFASGRNLSQFFEATGVDIGSDTFETVFSQNLASGFPPVDAFDIAQETIRQQNTAQTIAEAKPHHPLLLALASGQKVNQSVDNPAIGDVESFEQVLSQHLAFGSSLEVADIAAQATAAKVNEIEINEANLLSLTALASGNNVEQVFVDAKIGDIEYFEHTLSQNILADLPLTNAIVAAIETTEQTQASTELRHADGANQALTSAQNDSQNIRTTKNDEDAQNSGMSETEAANTNASTDNTETASTTTASNQSTQQNNDTSLGSDDNPSSEGRLSEANATAVNTDIASSTATFNQHTQQNNDNDAALGLDENPSSEERLSEANATAVNADLTSSAITPNLNTQPNSNNNGRFGPDNGTNKESSSILLAASENVNDSLSKLDTSLATSNQDSNDGGPFGPGSKIANAPTTSTANTTGEPASLFTDDSEGYLSITDDGSGRFISNPFIFEPFDTSSTASSYANLGYVGEIDPTSTSSYSVSASSTPLATRSELTTTSTDKEEKSSEEADPPVNRAPINSGGTINIDEDSAFLGNLNTLAMDPEGNSLVFQLLTQTNSGFIDFDSAGTFIYIPDANYNGNDSFTFNAIDALGTSTTATLNFTVNAVNDLPEITSAAQAGNITETADVVNGTDADPVSASGDIDFNDVDLINRLNTNQRDDPSASVTAFAVTTTTLTLTTSQISALEAAFSLDDATLSNASSISGNGSAGWTYNLANHDIDFLGADDNIELTFSVTINDNNGGTATQDVVITLNGTNDAPVITQGSGTAALTETDSALSTNGSLTVSDVDTTDLVTASVDSLVVNGTSNRNDPAAPTDAQLQAMLSITPTAIVDGNNNSAILAWNFDSNSEAFDYLANGETLILQYTIKAEDDSGAPLSDTETVTITITGANDAPIISDGPDVVALDETDAALSSVGTLTVSDVDTSDQITASVDSLSVSGTSNRSDPAAPTDAQLLAMLSVTPTAIVDGNNNSATLNWNFDSNSEAFNYLASGETLILQYTIKAEDNNGTPLNDTETVTITITGSNDVPVISSDGGAATANLFINENTTAVTTLTATDADTTDSHSYSIVGGADQNLFDMNASSGTLSLKTAPDFEAPTDSNNDGIYDVTVQVSDGTNTDTQAISITVNDVNEAPTAVTLTAVQSTIDENTDTSAGIHIANISVTDDALGTNTLGLTGTDAADFEIRNGTELYFIGDSPDYEIQSSYDVAVTADDISIGSTPDATSTAFTLSVNDLDDIIITSNGGGASAALSINENTATVTTVTATIAANTTSVFSANFEGTSLDAGIYTDIPNSLVSNVLLNTVNDTLEITANNSSTSMWTDRSNAAIAWANSPDVAVGETWSVETYVSLPSLTDTSGNQFVGLTFYDDLDGALPDITYSFYETLDFSLQGVQMIGLGDSDPDAGYSGMNSRNLYLKVDVTESGISDVYNFYYKVNAGDAWTQIIGDALNYTSNMANDRVGLFYTTDFAPTGTATGSIDYLTITSPAKPAYSIIGGADQALFNIDANTGALSFNATPDFETPTDSNNDGIYDVTVQVSDGTNTDTQAISITVNDANEAPTAVNLTTVQSTIDENSDTSAGIHVANIVVVDDALGSNTLGLTGADAADFEIRNGTELYFIGNSPDFETKASYDVAVTVDDTTVGSAPDATSTNFTLSVNDIVEDVNITSNGSGNTASISIAENASAVTTVTATTINTQTYFSTNFDGATLDPAITLDIPDAGLATVTLDAANSELDFTASGYIDMWSTRGDVPIAWTASPSVNIGETWSVETHVRFSALNNGQYAGLTFYDADSSVPDFAYFLSNWSSPSYPALQGLGDSDPYASATLSGNLDNLYLKVDVTENGASDTYNFFFKESFGDSWTQLTGDALNYASSVANSRVGLFFRTTTGTDDASFDYLNIVTPASMTYSLSGGADQALFDIDASTGALSFKSAPDFENPLDSNSDNIYDVTVQASDGIQTDNQDISVTVTNVPDPGSASFELPDQLQTDLTSPFPVWSQAQISDEVLTSKDQLSELNQTDSSASLVSSSFGSSSQNSPVWSAARISDQILISDNQTLNEETVPPEPDRVNPFSETSENLPIWSAARISDEVPSNENSSTQNQNPSDNAFEFADNAADTYRALLLGEENSVVANSSTNLNTPHNMGLSGTNDNLTSSDEDAIASTIMDVTVIELPETNIV